MSFLWGTALLLEFCSIRLTLRRWMLLKFSLLARPARVTSEKLELDDTVKGGQEDLKGGQEDAQLKAGAM